MYEWTGSRGRVYAFRYASNMNRPVLAVACTKNVVSAPDYTADATQYCMSKGSCPLVYRKVCIKKMDKTFWTHSILFYQNYKFPHFQYWYIPKCNPDERDSWFTYSRISGLISTHHFWHIGTTLEFWHIHYTIW